MRTGMWSLMSSTFTMMWPFFVVFASLTIPMMLTLLVLLFAASMETDKEALFLRMAESLSYLSRMYFTKSSISPEQRELPLTSPFIRGIAGSSPIFLAASISPLLLFREVAVLISPCGGIAFLRSSISTMLSAPGIRSMNSSSLSPVRRASSIPSRYLSAAGVKR